MSSYSIPHFPQAELSDPDVRAWINFLGNKGMFTTKERVIEILDLNAPAFVDDTKFSDDILELFESPYLSKDMQELLRVPRRHYRSYLTDHDKKNNNTIHHIIFQNNVMNGHVSEFFNLANMEAWKHSSFHQLLRHKNLYPHEQISRLLKLESDYLDRTFLTRLSKIESSYQKAFQKTPFEIYKPEVFSNNFHKQLKK